MVKPPFFASSCLDFKLSEREFQPYCTVQYTNIQVHAQHSRIMHDFVSQTLLCTRYWTCTCPLVCYCSAQDCQGQYRYKDFWGDQLLKWLRTIAHA